MDRMSRSGADFIYDVLGRELGWTVGADIGPEVVCARWNKLLEREDVPTAWRRHPHLLATMLRRAGLTITPDTVRWARQQRLARLPPSRKAMRRNRIDNALENFWELVGSVNVQDWLATSDGTTVADTLRRCARRWGWSRHVHDAVRARIHRMCESVGGGQFHSHRRRLDAELLKRLPMVYQYPVEVGRFLQRCVPDTGDAEHVLGFIGDVTCRRLLRLPSHRDPKRAILSVARRTVWILSLVWAGAERPAAGWRAHVWPAYMDTDELAERVARALGAWHRRARPARRWRTTPTVTDARRVMCGFLRCCASTGVFEPRIPATAAVLADVDLERRLVRLQAEDPERYAARPNHAVFRTVERTELTTEDVEALRATCRTAREHAFLALVSTTGVRSCAVAMARVDDVWDAARAEVRQRVCLREKNSDVRALVPSPDLRAALRTYVLERGSVGGDALLFPGRRSDREPAGSTARSMLRTLCRRAGFTHVFSPHQFRHFVVNELMKRGNRLECVSKWLGHRSTTVTYRHYWTDEAVGLVGGSGRREPVDDGASSTGTGGEMDQLYEALRAKVAEVEMLRALLLEGTSSPPRVDQIE